MHNSLHLQRTGQIGQAEFWPMLYAFIARSMLIQSDKINITPAWHIPRWGKHAVNVLSWN